MNRKSWFFIGGLTGLAIIIAGFGVVFASPAKYGMPGRYDATPITLTNKDGTALATDNVGRIQLSTSTSIVVSGAGTAANPISNGYFLNLNSVTSTITTIASSTKMGLGDGTAALPSLYFNSDTDTGLYSAAANTLGFSTSGTVKLTLDGAGILNLNSSVALASMATGVLADNGQFVTAIWNKRKIGMVAGAAVNVTSSTALTATNFRENMLVQGSGGAVTVSVAPSIASGQNGEVLCLVGNSDTNTLTYQDDNNLAGSTIKLNGNVNMTLGLDDELCLVYYTSHASWHERSRSNN